MRLALLCHNKIGQQIFLCDAYVNDSRGTCRSFMNVKPRCIGYIVKAGY